MIAFVGSVSYREIFDFENQFDIVCSKKPVTVSALNLCVKFILYLSAFSGWSCSANTMFRELTNRFIISLNKFNVRHPAPIFARTIVLGVISYFKSVLGVAIVPN